MEIKSRKEIEEEGKKYIENLAKKIIKEMPEITKEEKAILSARGNIIRVIPTSDIPLVLYNKVSEFVRKSIEEETFDTEKIDSHNQPIYEKEAALGIVISIFLKKEKYL